MHPERSIRDNHLPATRLKATRMVIYPKDIQLITGKSQRTAQSILQTIRRSLKKTKQQLVTIREYCQFAGIDEGDVYEFLAIKR